MATYQVLFWDGIPIGVKAADEDGQKRESLPLRFQAAVDAAATATGRTETRDYLAAWTWSEPAVRAGSAAEVATEIVAELEEAYPPVRIQEIRRQIVRRHEANSSQGSSRGSSEEPETASP